MIGEKIIYEFDNFTGLMPVEEFKKVFTYNFKLHWRSKDRIKPYIQKEKVGCYLIYNNNKEVIYVGKSSNCIRLRLIHHLFTNNAITVKYGERLEINYANKTKKLRIEAKYFSYTEIDKTDLSFVEVGLINKYKPKFNIKDNDSL